MKELRPRLGVQIRIVFYLEMVFAILETTKEAYTMSRGGTENQKECMCSCACVHVRVCCVCDACGGDGHIGGRAVPFHVFHKSALFSLYGTVNYLILYTQFLWTGIFGLN